MKIITGVFAIVLCASFFGSRNLCLSANPSTDEDEAEQAADTASSAPQTAAPIPAASQASAAPTGAVMAAGGETNALPAPVQAKDPAKCIIAHFGFDGSLQPDMGSSYMIPVTFKRESAAYFEGQAVTENLPRLVEGKFGKAVLLESAYANLFSIGQAGAAEATAFSPVQGAALLISSDQPWQGKESLAVATKGENSEEGFSAEAAVEKAFYTKENLSIVPAYYLASLYLRGQGNLKITLKDVESGTCGEPVYVELSANWQRFFCLFGYNFARINIGENHEGDWKKSIPPGTNIDAKLHLICTTVDSQKLNFFADGLQLEKRYAASGKNTELSPHSWILGAFQTAQEQLAIDVKNDYFNTWKKNGSIAFWFKPLWEARDDSKELVLQIAKSQLGLSHDSHKIIFSPAGVSFTPYDWKNNWHYMVVTWNGTGERMLYVDGLDYPNAAGEAKPIKDPEGILAGDFAKNLSPNGAFDELTLYNITLNSEQVKTLAAAEPKVKPAELKTPEQSSAPTGAADAPARTEPASGARQADQEGENEENQ